MTASDGAAAVTVAPRTAEDVRDAIASASRVRLRGGATKTQPRPPAGTLVVSTHKLSGILEYDPSEFTFTALAGTPVTEVTAALGEHGQMLPFDPPLASRGATLGGTVGAGLSGSGRYRNGGVRDFILGVRFVDGYDRLVRGGGKVVKNAAGFDFPKLMVGSLGRLGALVELTFKVFPRPDAHRTLQLDVPSVGEAVAAVRRLSRSPWDLTAVDIVCDASITVDIRMSGLASALPGRVDALRAFLGGGAVLSGDAEAALWQESSEFSWMPEDCRLVKVPLTPGRIASFDAAVCSQSIPRRYAAGGQVAWVAWPGHTEGLATHLAAEGLAGQIVLGPPEGESVIFGARDGGAFATRMKAAMDPTNRFG